jgi:hypothetical protein
LTGPRAITFREVIKEISIATDRSIAFNPVSLSAYIHMLKEHGVPADYIWLINYLFSEVLDAEGNNIVTQDVEKVLSRKPIDFTEYITETVKTGIWNEPLIAGEL